MARDLTAYEVQRLLANDADLARRVSNHRRLVAVSGWDQVALMSYDRDAVNIPVRGLAVGDIYLGPVIVFPDAAGGLHFLLPTTAAEQSFTATINDPNFVSPDAGWLAMLEDMARNAVEVGTSAVQIAVVVASAVFALFIVKSLRG